MFLKVVFKNEKEDGTRRIHYRMIESYRTGDQVKHQNILHLGALDQIPHPDQIRALGKRIDQLVKEKATGNISLFKVEDSLVENLAQQYSDEIITKYKTNEKPDTEFQLINTESIKNEDIREMGCEWLCHQALDQLQLATLFRNKGWNAEQIQLAYTHIISRCTHPASEYSTTKWINQNSGVCEITGYAISKVTKDKLYGMSRSLYSIKDSIERHLSTTSNELFDLHDSILIYDLTNTYFEGKMSESKIAKRGHSKEKRSDAKLIVLALVINAEGFIKYSNIFEGNTNDSTTITKIITTLTARTVHMDKKPIVVIDAGIASEDNLKMIKALGYDYMCVSRTGIKKYQVDTSSIPISVSDNLQKSITLQRVTVPGKEGQFILVHSTAKEAKEIGMNDQAKLRFETGLQQIKIGLSRKGGVKTIDKVHERIGRLKQKYQSIHRNYTIQFTQNDKEIKTIEWYLKENSMSKNFGKYLLRTSLPVQSEKTQWIIYNTIREIENTFR
ncbi:MAG: IS1634 family transposase, partial [Saprospiraceae bacterium]